MRRKPTYYITQYITLHTCSLHYTLSYITHLLITLHIIYIIVNLFVINLYFTLHTYIIINLHFKLHIKHYIYKPTLHMWPKEGGCRWLWCVWSLDGVTIGLRWQDNFLQSQYESGHLWSPPPPSCVCRASSTKPEEGCDEIYSTSKAYQSESVKVSRSHFDD